MENSNTLPKIEVGDTVIFRTDLVDLKRYNDTLFWNGQKKFWKNGKGIVENVLDDETFIIEGTHLLHSVGMVAQVIKPTEERVYTEDQLQTAIEMAREVGMKGYSYTVRQIIESLNK